MKYNGLWSYFSFQPGIKFGAYIQCKPALYLPYPEVERPNIEFGGTNSHMNRRDGVTKY
ncbi:uncharacterized protein J3R85_008470 [Psidium guajava]|nr:uncharacterized protein J3R85_008470 [Psidium guajava]